MNRSDITPPHPRALIPWCWCTQLVSRLRRRTKEEPMPIPEKLLQEIETRNLVLPFPAPKEPHSVVSVAFRNEWGTGTAVLVMSGQILAVCEHGARASASNFPEAFRLLRHPSFCDACIAHAVDAGRLPTR